MNQSAWETIFVTVGAILIIALLAGIAYVTGNWKCDNRWGESGMAHKYTYTAGCMVEHKPGSWIPEAHYRAVE